MYMQDNLHAYQKLVIRMDIENPLISYVDIPKIAHYLFQCYHVEIDTRRYYYETPRIIHTTGKLMSGVPEHVVKAVKGRFRLFRYERLLEIQYKMNGDFAFGPFGA